MNTLLPEPATGLETRPTASAAASRPIPHPPHDNPPMNAPTHAAYSQTLGIQARAYPGGRMTYRFEEPLHRFQNMVADYMTGMPQVPVGDEP